VTKIRPKKPKKPKNHGGHITLGKENPGVYRVSVEGEYCGEVEANNQATAEEKYKHQFPNVANAGFLVLARWDRKSAFKATTILDPARPPAGSEALKSSVSGSAKNRSDARAILDDYDFPEDPNDGSFLDDPKFHALLSRLSERDKDIWRQSLLRDFGRIPEALVSGGNKK
jgi:hypothetical protein